MPQLCSMQLTLWVACTCLLATAVARELQQAAAGSTTDQSSQCDAAEVSCRKNACSGESET